MKVLKERIARRGAGKQNRAMIRISDALRFLTSDLSSALFATRGNRL